jgi:hypothetical protein
MLERLAVPRGIIIGRLGGVFAAFVSAPAPARVRSALIALEC